MIESHCSNIGNIMCPQVHHRLVSCGYYHKYPRWCTTLVTLLKKKSSLGFIQPLRTTKLAVFHLELWILISYFWGSLLLALRRPFSVFFWSTVGEIVVFSNCSVFQKVTSWHFQDLPLSPLKRRLSWFPQLLRPASVCSLNF